MTTSKIKPIDRKRIDEALLADRLGLNEPWIERWEEAGEWRGESGASDRLPSFIRKDYKVEIEDIENEIDRLVAAGCRRQVVHFCLAQLSPEAVWLRAGGERKPVFKGAHVGAVLDADSFDQSEQRLAARKPLRTLTNTAKAARRQIHRFQRELVLVAEAARYPLPAGLTCQPESPVDALTLLTDSLTWAATLAAAYTTPFESTLLKSKGLLYLTLYVSMAANAKMLRGSKPASFHRDGSKPSDSVRARRTSDAGDPLTNLASVLTPEGRGWSPSDLHRKLNSFREDHPRLYKRLAEKLKELHDFASR